jgi:hypothetical protein
LTPWRHLLILGLLSPPVLPSGSEGSRAGTERRADMIRAAAQLPKGLGIGLRSPIPVPSWKDCPCVLIRK